jgi:hypothetical protein
MKCVLSSNFFHNSKTYPFNLEILAQYCIIAFDSEKLSVLILHDLLQTTKRFLDLPRGWKIENMKSYKICRVEVSSEGINCISACVESKNFP